LADLQRTVYPHSGHPSSEGRAQDRVSSPAKDRRSANCATLSELNAERHARNQISCALCESTLTLNTVCNKSAVYRTVT